MINFFHKNIAHGPEYVCTCCNQLWHKCSVVKCDANKYKVCSPEVVEFCLTGFKSADNAEWIPRLKTLVRSGQDLGEIMARSLIKSWQDLW